MSTVTHEPRAGLHERPAWVEALGITQMWASLAIISIWLAVLFDGVYGPSFVSTNGATTTTVPSVIAVALFALLATPKVAKYGFRHPPQ